MIKKHQPLRKFPDYKSSISRSPNKEPLWINSSSSEMSGPLFNEKIINKNDNDLTLNFSKTGEKPLGQEIFVHGFVKDENGNYTIKPLAIYVDGGRNPLVVQDETEREDAQKIIDMTPQAVIDSINT